MFHSFVLLETLNMIHKFQSIGIGLKKQIKSHFALKSLPILSVAFIPSAARNSSSSSFWRLFSFLGVPYDEFYEELTALFCVDTGHSHFRDGYYIARLGSLRYPYLV